MYTCVSVYDAFERSKKKILRLYDEVKQVMAAIKF